jgi:ribosomal protein S18 acetylase RimI-like enzyme
MNENIIIRKFTASDRQALRWLCYNVADRGSPLQAAYFDKELVLDLLTSYYTDFEPQLTFVAEVSGEIVGYVNACSDNRHYGLVMFWFIIPKAVLKGFKRGVFFRREFWQLIKTMLRNWRRLLTWRKASFHSHQGHLHIGISPSYQKQQVGQRLMGALCDYAKKVGIDELTASVHSSNPAACRFFERLGFSIKGSYAMVAPRGEGIEAYYSIYYVKKI